MSGLAPSSSRGRRASARRTAARLRAASNLAITLRPMGGYPTARTLLEEALARRREIPGPGTPSIRVARAALEAVDDDAGCLRCVVCRQAALEGGLVHPVIDNLQALKEREWRAVFHAIGSGLAGGLAADGGVSD